MDVKDPEIRKKVALDDQILDQTLRPRTFPEYIGQEKVKANLAVIIGAAKKRKESMDHTLIHGPSGLGKTTLAYLIAKEFGANLRVTSGTALEKAGDVGAILTSLSDSDVLFIDEVHRLNKTVEEILYPAMENFKLDIVIGKGTGAKTLQIDLPRFTLIAATTRISLLSSPFRSRFGVNLRLNFYTPKEITHILERSAALLGISATPEALATLARAARATPRVANRLLKRARDFAQMASADRIGEPAVNETLRMLDIDHEGLEETDRRILLAIADSFNGGPAGLKSIAASISEEERTIEDVYEPYLMQIGFLARTPKGRIITDSGLKHLGRTVRKPALGI